MTREHFKDASRYGTIHGSLGYAQTYAWKSGQLNRYMDTLASGHTYIWTSVHMERQTHEPVEEMDRQTY